MTSQLGLNFSEEIACKCGAKYYGSIPEVCIFCEVKKQNKIIINFKVDSGYRTSMQNCAMCFYSSIVENGSLVCLALSNNDGIEFTVEETSICNHWADDSEMDSQDE